MTDTEQFIASLGSSRMARIGTGGGKASVARQRHRAANACCLRDPAGLATFGRAVRQARQSQGRTIAGLSRAAGIDSRTLHRVQNGGSRCGVSNKIILALCRVLDLDPYRWIPRDQINE